MSSTEVGFQKVFSALTFAFTLLMELEMYPSFKQGMWKKKKLYLWNMKRDAPWTFRSPIYETWIILTLFIILEIYHNMIHRTWNISQLNPRGVKVHNIIYVP